MKVDAIQLADVFEELQTMSLIHYGLDPVHYFTLPGLAWDAILKYTKVELELFTEDKTEMFIMTEAGICGGISTITHRFANANNKYMKDYDETKESSYIKYLHMNNLYGAGMSEALPTGGFEWMTDSELKNWKRISNTEGKGCILTVDLCYRKHIRRSHNNLPLVPEHLNRKLIPNLKQNKICSTL